MRLYISFEQLAQDEQLSGASSIVNGNTGSLQKWNRLRARNRAEQKRATRTRRTTRHYTRKEKAVPKEGFYTSKEVCEKVGVSKNTLLKWLDQSLISEPELRTVYQFLWSEKNIENINEYIERRRR